MPINVFLVEDQQHMRSVLSELLLAVADFRFVGSAATEAEALSWLDTHRGLWDLCVIDLVLDQGSGIGVIVRARLRGGELSKVAVLSSFVSPGIRKHCLKLGADAAFQKDSDLREFIEFCSAVPPRPETASAA